MISGWPVLIGERTDGDSSHPAYKSENIEDSLSYGHVTVLKFSVTIPESDVRTNATLFFPQWNT